MRVDRTRCVGMACIGSLALAVFACGDTAGTGAMGTGGAGASGGAAEAGGGGLGGAAPVDRGPTVLDVDGDPNGLYWDAGQSALLVADDNGNRVLKWSDADGFDLVAELPTPSGEGAGLGQLVRTDDGTIVVTRFGFGTDGDVAFVEPNGTTGVVPNISTERRRIGLSIGGDGTLYDGYFVRLANGDRLGSVAMLSLAGTEQEVMTGLSKPVGVLVIGDALFVSDQDLGQILTAPLATPEPYGVVADVDGPDLLAAGPDGSLFTGSTGGELYQVSASGEASVLQGGFQQIRGVAYDPDHERLFVADHDGDETDGITHRIHILPIGGP